MNKIFRFAATLTGAFALVTGFTACSKDDDNGGDHGECCTYSYSGTDEYGNAYSYSYTMCEDGTYTYSNSDGESFSANWKTSEDYDGLETWEDIKSYIQEYSNGAKCN